MSASSLVHDKVVRWLTTVVRLIAATQRAGSWSRPRARRSAVVVVLLAAVFGAGCDEMRTPPSPELAKWLRDSAVVDSLSRFVNTDSLYHTYHRLLTSEDARVVLPAAACQRWRLRKRHGFGPATMAIERMFDTLWTPADSQLLDESFARLKGGAVEESENDDDCDVRGIVPGPDTVNGVSTMLLGSRPER